MSTGSLNERAMLVSLSIGTWEGRKKDRSVTSSVLNTTKADADAGAWWTRIIPPKSLVDIHRAIDKGRALTYELTLPWSDAGQRILPAAMFTKFTKEMRTARDSFNTAVDKFLDIFPDLVRDAKNRLGDLFNENAFPTKAQLQKKFKWEVSFAPLPLAEDFRVDLGSDRTKEIIDQIKQQNEAQVTAAMQSVWSRVYAGVSKIADRLGDPEAIFRDSLISNLRDMCELIPALNIAEDSNLAHLKDMVVRKLTTTDPDVLRKNPATRADVAAQATNLLNKMKPFVQGDNGAE